MTGNVYSVGQVNAYIKNMFAQDFMLSHIYVRGEVSNCKYHSSGHIYFTLKDKSGVLSAVMFAGSRKNGLKFRMKEGDKCIVLGAIRVYERDGKYQLYANQIVLEGAGLLYQRFEALKRELAEMGMFAPEYKQPIPKYARRVGVVTAPTGAAVRDIQNISHRRNPYVQVILYPAQVQGEGAAASIVDGIHALADRDVDVIIIGRGGGSIEDLWAFNEETVARAIFDCPVPIISAVGHETDTTIADYVADLRAPTPSAAAELAVFDIRQVFDGLDGVKLALNRRMSNRIAATEDQIRAYRLRLEVQNPKTQVLEQRHRTADLQDAFQVRMKELLCEKKETLEKNGETLQARMERILFDAKEKMAENEAILQNCMEFHFNEKRHQLELYAATLDGQSPLKKLQSGFAFVANADGKRIKSVSDVKHGERIRAWVADGRLTAVVEDIEKSQWTELNGE